jgi:Tfp pilus assembly protein PilX
MINKPLQIRSRHRQSGIALVTSLIIMMILTILGVTVMNMTSLEEKMAFNTQDRYMARYLAESAVVLMADPDLLPPPNEPGTSSFPFTLPTDSIPKLQSASGQITYVQETPYSNMPKSNTRSQYLSSGSGDDNAVVYQIFATVDTKAGTTSRMRAGYYYVRHNQN